jgi:hypothetical protein
MIMNESNCYGFQISEETETSIADTNPIFLSAMTGNPATEAIKFEDTGYSKHSVEIIDMIEHMPFNRGNAIRYICRASHRPNNFELTDLKTALYYLQREINRVESNH